MKGSSVQGQRKAKIKLKVKLQGQDEAENLVQNHSERLNQISRSMSNGKGKDEGQYQTRPL